MELSAAGAPAAEAPTVQLREGTDGKCFVAVPGKSTHYSMKR